MEHEELQPATAAIDQRISLTASIEPDETIDDGEGLTPDIDKVDGAKASDRQELGRVFNADKVQARPVDVGRGASAPGFLIEYWPEIIGGLGALDILLNHATRIEQAREWLRSKRNRREIGIPNPSSQAAIAAEILANKLGLGSTASYCSTTKLNDEGRHDLADPMVVFRNIFLSDDQFYVVYLAGDGGYLGHAVVPRSSHSDKQIRELTPHYVDMAIERCWRNRGLPDGG